MSKSKRSFGSYKERLTRIYRRIEIIESVHELYYALEVRMNRAIDVEYAENFAKLVNQNSHIFVPMFSSLHFQLVVELNSITEGGQYGSLGKLVGDIKSPELIDKYNALRKDNRDIISYIKGLRSRLYAHYGSIDTSNLPGFNYLEMKKLINDVKQLIVDIHVVIDGRSIAHWQDVFSPKTDAVGEFISRLKTGYSNDLTYDECLVVEADFIKKLHAWEVEA